MVPATEARAPLDVPQREREHGKEQPADPEGRSTLMGRGDGEPHMPQSLVRIRALVGVGDAIASDLQSRETLRAILHHRIRLELGVRQR